MGWWIMAKKDWYEREWGRSAFMCNVIMIDLMAKPDGIILIRT
ncbi:MAG: hypothetical protein CM15mV2_1370 [uncultured marine virus]|nr:MAG: hypothetical protein CM15mV2_1370 [uncultured marine virus]